MLVLSSYLTASLSSLNGDGGEHGAAKKSIKNRMAIVFGQKNSWLVSFTSLFDEYLSHHIGDRTIERHTGKKINGIGLERALSSLIKSAFVFP